MVRTENIIKIWDLLRMKNPGELVYSDLEDAIKEVVGVYSGDGGQTEETK